MIKKLLRYIIRFQHQNLPLPLFFIKYFLICFDSDLFFNKPKTTQFKKNYWLSKKSLFWHYAHLYNNRYSEIFKNLYETHNDMFEDKKVLDLMSGLGPLYRKIDTSNFTFIEQNKFCCEHLRKTFPESTIVNSDWKRLKDFENKIDTLILTNGNLIDFDQLDIDTFFDYIKKIKNLILIRDGTFLKDFTDNHTGYNLWNIIDRLKAHNLNYKSSEFYYEKGKNYYKYFIMKTKN